jgi:hypothetical protein
VVSSAQSNPSGSWASINSRNLLQLVLQPSPHNSELSEAHACNVGHPGIRTFLQYHTRPHSQCYLCHATSSQERQRVSLVVENLVIKLFHAALSVELASDPVSLSEHLVLAAKNVLWFVRFTTCQELNRKAPHVYDGDVISWLSQDLETPKEGLRPTAYH